MNPIVVEKVIHPEQKLVFKGERYNLLNYSIRTLLDHEGKRGVQLLLDCRIDAPQSMEITIKI